MKAPVNEDRVQTDLAANFGDKVVQHFAKCFGPHGINAQIAQKGHWQTYKDRVEDSKQNQEERRNYANNQNSDNIQRQSNNEIEYMRGEKKMQLSDSNTISTRPFLIVGIIICLFFGFWSGGGKA